MFNQHCYCDCITAYIAENTEEKYGLLFVGSCGVVGALAMLAIAVLTARKRS